MQYFSIKKAEKSLQELLQKPYPNPHYYQGSFQVPPPATAHEEEDVALALLIEQLRHREHQEVTLQLMDYPSSSQHMDPAESCTFNSITNQDNNTSSNNNPSTHFDEYYGGLDSLHGSNPCTFSFLDQWSGGSGEDQWRRWKMVFWSFLLFCYIYRTRLVPFHMFAPLFSAKRVYKGYHQNSEMSIAETAFMFLKWWNILYMSSCLFCDETCSMIAQWVESVREPKKMKHST